MKRVVFCWELGGNYGHIAGFVGLARAFTSRDCEVVFVLRNLQYAGLLGDGVTCVQAPIPNIIPHQRDSYSYTGILASIGYRDKTVLAAYVDAWRKLLEEYQADLVVADHAPTAILAGQSIGVPVAAIGTGFVIPPFTTNFPQFTSNLVEPDVGLDEQILANINYAMLLCGGQALDNLGDIFGRAQSYLCTLPELDHYGVRADAEYWGPLFSANQGLEPQWPALMGARIFAYLTVKLTNLEQVIAGLAQLSCPVLLHIPGLSEEQCAAWSVPSIKIEARAVNMGSVFAQAEMIVSQGGMGMSAQCILTGARHVIIPTQMEQVMLARRLSDIGLAYAVNAETAFDEYGAVFNRALTCKVLAKNSKILAQKYQGFSQDEQLDALVEDMLDLLLR